MVSMVEDLGEVQVVDRSGDGVDRKLTLVADSPEADI